MKERPILFKGDMVRAILDGRKTQTRRVCDRKIWDLLDKIYAVNSRAERDCLDFVIPCPYGEIGDRLWVRETHRITPTGYEYRADDNHIEAFQLLDDLMSVVCDKWKSPLFMPRCASRITLEITNVRVERLQQISTEDAKAEGIYIQVDWKGDSYWECDGVDCCHDSPIDAYRCLWDRINAKRGFGFDANPWVWVLEFRKV